LSDSSIATLMRRQPREAGDAHIVFAVRFFSY